MIQVRPGRRRKFRVPRGSLGALSDPFRQAFKVGARGDKGRASAGVFIAMSGHVFVGYLAFTTVPPPVQQPKPKEIPVIVAQQSPPPPPPVVPPPPPPPQKNVEGRQVHNAAPHQAARVISSKPIPGSNGDFTSFAMPTGEGDHYEGGETTAIAPPKPPESDPVVAKHVAAFASKAREANAVNDEWNCTWPDAEQASEIHAADVTINIKVGKDGRADEVTVVHAPNANFGEGAKQCGLDQHYEPAWDDAGHPIISTIDNFVIHFVR